MSRMVSGALTLIRTHKSSASSKGVIGLWCMSAQPCFSLRNGGHHGLNRRHGEDRLGNQIIWLLAGVIAHTFRKHDELPTESLRSTRTRLAGELDMWLESLPASFTGMELGDPSLEGLLKRWFAVPSTGEQAFTPTFTPN